VRPRTDAPSAGSWGPSRHRPLLASAQPFHHERAPNDSGYCSGAGRQPAPKCLLETGIAGGARPGRWILIVEPVDRPHYFWQALAFEDGSLCTEVVSNHYLPDEHHWSPSEEEQLLALGWEWHTKPWLTNWISVQATTTPDVTSVAPQALRTLRELFAMGDDDKVLIKMFSSSIRGDTPASAEYSMEDEAAPLGDLESPFGRRSSDDEALNRYICRSRYSAAFNQHL
jgi:hypothetical protein